MNIRVFRGRDVGGRLRFFFGFLFIIVIETERVLDRLERGQRLVIDIGKDVRLAFGECLGYFIGLLGIRECRTFLRMQKGFFSIYRGIIQIFFVIREKGLQVVFSRRVGFRYFGLGAITFDLFGGRRFCLIVN